MLTLALNGGSSSLKLALYETSAAGESLVASGQVADIGPAARLEVSRADSGGGVERRAAVADVLAALEVALDALVEIGSPVPEAVGHRVVHGGADLVAPAVVDDRVLGALRELVPFAPLHLPTEIAVIDAVAARWPGIRQVACFDTAFHRRMPEAAQRYPLPDDLWRDGVRRYGFHGLSYEYVVDELGQRATGRVVVAHLGSGASLAAIGDRAPVDTTMGFTPTGGIPMGTRSGDLDPGVLIHLLRRGDLGADDLDRLVNRDAGLKGLSGTTSDMKALLDARPSDPRAALAVEIFCRRVRATIGSYAALLGGLDVLVFTGGIGENAAEIRAEVCDGLGHLGVEVDSARNVAGGPQIGAPGAAVEALVVRTCEEQMVARHTYRALVDGPASAPLDGDQRS